MATTSTPVTRSAYNKALEDNRTKANIKSYEETVKSYEKNRDELVSILRDLRTTHLNHVGAYGVGNVENAISELEYSLRSVKSSLKTAQSRLESLKGNTVVDEDDE